MNGEHGPIESSQLRCVTCGYDLSGTPIGGRCPECGEAVEASIRSAQAIAAERIGKTSAAAVASLILGLLCLLACPPLGVIAIILGRVARGQIVRGGYSPGSSALATVGEVLGWIGLLFTAGAVLLMCAGLSVP